MGRIARTGSSPEKLFTINIACRERDGNGTNVPLGKPRIPSGLKRYLCLMHPVQFIYAKT